MRIRNDVHHTMTSKDLVIKSVYTVAGSPDECEWPVVKCGKPRSLMLHIIILIGSVRVLHLYRHIVIGHF
jgi:hypothetical protein